MHDNWKRVGGALGVLALMACAGIFSTHEAIQTTLGILFLLVGLPMLIMAMADALRSPLAEPGPSAIRGPLPDEFEFEFVSTLKDLLNAQEESFEERSGIRRWIRWGPIAFGWMFLIVGLASIGREEVGLVQHLVWVGMGSFLLYSLQFKHLLERRHIRREQAQETPTKLRFDAQGIHAKGNEGREVSRPWADLLDFGVRRKGFSFCFELGMATWVPLRVFCSAHERELFIQAIAGWHARALEAAAREQAIKERAWGLQESEFWQLIDLLDPQPGLDDPAALRALVDELAEREVEQIKGFHDILAEQLFLLDSKAHKQAMGSEAEGKAQVAFTEQDYLGARCLVVASGRQVTRALRRFPEAMPTEKGFPSLVKVAAMAYERKCGEPFHFQPMKSFAMGSNPEGWPKEKAAE